MHMLFCHDIFYSQRRDGTVVSYGTFPYAFWERRFLPYFESMTVLGRKKKLNPEETGVLSKSSGRNVEHILLPNIHSFRKRFTKSRMMYRKIRAEVEKADAIVISGPVEFGMIAAEIARELGKPYAIEMSGCAYDQEYYRSGFLGRICAPSKFKKAQKMVQHADAVIYVTERFLQERYPTSGVSEHASHVEISAPPEYVLSGRLERIEKQEEPLNIGLIGNFGNGLKGIDVAIKALGLVEKAIQSRDDLPDFHFKVLGQGLAAQWQGLIRDVGLEDKVEFCGTVSQKKDVLAWLDEVDVYLQPSYHEGLARSLIEAMSRGCPALASDAGGTQELLDAQFIHQRGDAESLASQIIYFMEDAGCQREAAQQNFEKAKNYTREVLVPRRSTFWERFAALAKKKSGARSENSSSLEREAA